MSIQFEEGELVLVAGKSMKLVALSGDKARCAWENNRNELKEEVFNANMLRKNCSELSGGSDFIKNLFKKWEIGDKVLIVGNKMYLESIDNVNDSITCIWFNTVGNLIRGKFPKFLLGMGSTSWRNYNFEPRTGFANQLKQILK